MGGERKLVVREGDRVRDVLLVGPVTVGRSPLCEISGSDPRLSREHAVFEVVGDDVVVRDLSSRNGTRVNGASISERRLLVGDAVEVGPFVVQLAEPIRPVKTVAEQPAAGNEDATVLRPRLAVSGGTQHPALPPAAEVSPRPAPAGGNDEETVRLPRRSPATPELVSPREAAAPRTTPSVPATAPDRQTAKPDLSFAGAALLWVLPLALLSLVAGLVPSLLEPDQRGPLLQAHYTALATSAVELVRASREPDLPLDGVTTALVRQAGVATARILEIDGRVLAPLHDAGTRLDRPALEGAAARVRNTEAGLVQVDAAATTAEGRPVVVALLVDASKFHPAPAGSPATILALLACLGCAWAVARKLTLITNSRLSRLGEEVELMTTGQVAIGRDPFGLAGGQRVLDAATFALSTSRRPNESSPPASRPLVARPGQDVSGARIATIEADAGFCVVTADAGCQSLLGVTPQDMHGQHLIDALRDPAIADEVLRLVTLAVPGRPASGEASPGGRDYRLSIEVVRSVGQTPVAICFKRL